MMDDGCGVRGAGCGVRGAGCGVCLPVINPFGAISAARPCLRRYITLKSLMIQGATGRQGDKTKKVSGATLRRELPMMIEFTVKDKFFIVPILYSFSGGRGCSCSGFSGVSTAVPSGFLLAARRREMRFA